jgi:hypothetical protein
MVCEKCEKKLAKVITPDVWKDGARNVTGGKDGGRKVGVNMILLKKHDKKYYDPFGSKCSDCKCKVEKDTKYCNKCAYAKGLCKMCGTKIISTQFYKMSNV